MNRGRAVTRSLAVLSFTRCRVQFWHDEREREEMWCQFGFTLSLYLIKVIIVIALRRVGGNQQSVAEALKRPRSTNRRLHCSRTVNINVQRVCEM